MKAFLRIFLACILLAILSAGGMAAYTWNWFHQPQLWQHEKTVLISPGTGGRALVEQLHQAEVIPYPWMFKAMLAFHNHHRDLKAGEYLFESGITPREIMNKLVDGDVITHSITIPEGKNSREIMAILAAEARLSGDLPATPPAEGTLLPNTYHFNIGDKRASIIALMQDHMQQMLANSWHTPAADSPIQTLEQALTLASIVEKETGVDGERGMVASVFYNRLRMGMPLQSDPTVAYAMELIHGEPLGRPLYTKDLKTDHPYNTYTRKGLPPGPICNPGKAALMATLNPPQSDYLYFVATGNGGHHFAKTLAEHNRYVAQYRSILRQQGAR